MGYGNLELRRRRIKKDVTDQFEKDENIRRKAATRKKNLERRRSRSKNNYRYDLYEEDDYGEYGNPIGLQNSHLQRNMELIGQGDDIDYQNDPNNLIFHTNNSMEPKLTENGLKRRKVIEGE